MAQLITLTPTPVRVTASGTWQNLFAPVDAQPFDEVYLLAQVLAFENPSSPTATIGIGTGMQTETDDGWLSVVTHPFTTVSNRPFLLTKAGGGFLRYVRWRVVSLTNLSAVTFWIGGVGRTYANTP